MKKLIINVGANYYYIFHVHFFFTEWKNLHFIVFKLPIYITFTNIYIIKILRSLLEIIYQEFFIFFVLLNIGICLV